MMDIDSFFEILKEICDELPDEFFQDLHHGVQLAEELKLSPYAKTGDLVIMGEYAKSIIGNKITIYYGSFEKTCMWMTREQLKDKLREVVRHEFRHHMENRSGIHGKDSLEQEDKDEIRRYLRQ